MAGFERDFIYCSALLPVKSLDSELSDRLSPIYSYADSSDSPELTLIKKIDRRRLRDWARQLPAPLAVVARGLLRGETQAAMSRTLGISEPAVKKRLDRLASMGKRQLRDLRYSLLLT